MSRHQQLLRSNKRLSQIHNCAFLRHFMILQCSTFTWKVLERFERGQENWSLMAKKLNFCWNWIILIPQHCYLQKYGNKNPSCHLSSSFEGNSMGWWIAECSTHADRVAHCEMCQPKLVSNLEKMLSRASESKYSENKFGNTMQ